MWGDWLEANDIILMIEELVLDKKQHAFAHNGHTHFYSGPRKDIQKLIDGVLVINHRRALRRRQQLGAVIIDDTCVGSFLLGFKGIGKAVVSGKGTFDYFKDNPRFVGFDKVEQALIPWYFASRLFALTAWGHVSTTVCGAAPTGAYYTIEAPYGINEDHPTPAGMSPLKDTIKALFVPRRQPIEFINLFPFDRIKKLYTPTDWKKAHKAICLGEIRMARHEALKGIEPKTIREGLKLAAQEVLLRPVEVFQFFLESQECYHVDQDYMFKNTTARPRKSAVASPAVRQVERQRTLKEFGLMALECVKAELALLPPAERPAVPAFSLIDGRVTLGV